MKTRKRYQQGWFDREDGRVYHRFRDLRADGTSFKPKVLIGTEEEFPNDRLALLSPIVVANLKRLNTGVPDPHHAHNVVTVEVLMKDFKDKFCVRPNLAPGTISAYSSYISKWVLPRWGKRAVTEMKLSEANRWLASADLAPKSKNSLRWMMKAAWDYGQREGLLPDETPDIWTKIRIDGGSRRTYVPASFSPLQFRYILDELKKDTLLGRTAAAICGCIGPRISEVLGLKFSDIDKRRMTISIVRGWTSGELTNLKNEASRKAVPLSSELAEIIDEWRHNTPYNKETDWVFASVTMKGQQPIWADSLRQDHLLPAIERAINKLRRDHCVAEANDLARKEHLGWHTFRHTHKKWHSEIGTPIELQQRLLRHADLRTTQQYGVDLGVSQKERNANNNVVQFALKKKVKAATA